MERSRDPLFRKNITKYKKSFCQTSRMPRKLFFVLKVMKNYSSLLFSKIKDRKILRFSDAYFSPFFEPPDVIRQCGRIPRFVVLHDILPVMFPEYFSGDSWYNQLINSLDKETYYFCNSECTKKDLIKFFGAKLDENKMIVTPLSTQRHYSPDYNKDKLYEALSRYGIKQNQVCQYIFSFCDLNPRKNIIFTIKCFIAFISKYKIDNLYFYLGGPLQDVFAETMEKQLNDFGAYQDKIIRLGYVDDGDVNILYSNALFFTYISRYEGFGMPPLEAMQAGVPVITSNNSSLPEVVGDAAITIDCDSEEQCIKAFEALYFNEDLRKYYIEKGLERAKLFSWEKTVKIMADTIIRAVESRTATA
jgi:glycosyltransferase involved in cell wall biosynthesis